MNLTVTDVATHLHCTRQTVYKLLSAPDGLRGRKVAERWLISEQDLSDYIEAQENRRRKARRSA